MPRIRAAVRRLQAGGTRVGVAVVPVAGGTARTLGALRSGHAWSTIKVPIAAAAIDAGAGRAEDVEAALRRSDNAAAARLYAALGEDAAERVEDVLRRGGDERTRVNRRPDPRGFSTYGQTTWALQRGARFFASLHNGCVPGRRRILGHLARIDPSQRWGLAGLPQARAKAGWGPERGQAGYMAIQFGILRDHAYGLIARPATGSFDDATRALTTLATAIARERDLPAATTRQIPCR